MISNREIKGQIDELTEQNQFLTQELQQIKELLQNQTKQQNKGQDQDQGQDQGQEGQGRKQSRQNQEQSTESGSGGQDGGDSMGAGGQQDQQSGQQEQQDRQSQQGQGQSSQRDNGSNNQIFDIANDFLKLKELTSSLEKKMQEYTSGKSGGGGSLTEEDVINLVLSMMNGMIDWTMDFASKPKQGNQPSRLQ